MHDLPVSTTERRPETSLTEHSSNSSRIGRAMSAASHTGSQEERNPDSTGTTLEPRGQPCKTNWIVASSGAGDGNRTHVRSLGSLQSNSKDAGLAAFLRFSERLNWKIMENGKRPIHTTMNVYGKAMVPTQRRRSQQNSRRQNGPHHTVGHGPRRWPTKPSRP